MALAGASATVACANRLEDTSLEGRTIYSESVMLSGADASGRHFAAVRVCTYPDADVAWLWGMLLTPEGFHQFASNDIPWRGGRAENEAGDAARYAVRGGGGDAGFQRQGALAAPREARLEAAFESMPTLRPDIRAGRVRIEAIFAPREGYAGLLPGRTESFGRAAFRCTIDGRAVAFDGPAQFHEQAQDAPRFTTPFAFASLWSDDMFATLLDTPNGGGGYLIDGERAHALADVRAALAPASLALDFTQGGAAGRIALDPARIYHVPVYGRAWTGRFVRGVHAGRQLVGFLNSWAR